MRKQQALTATAAAAVILAACAGEPGPSSDLLGGADLARSSLGGPRPAIAPIDDGAVARRTEPGKRNLASRVLAAMALERVTGRKPDPIHFVERP